MSDTLDIEPSSHQRHIVITGAAGFVGQRLITELLSNPQFDDCRLTLTDLALTTPAASRVRVIQGDLCDPVVLKDVISPQPPDIVFHLAGVLGGAAEANYELSKRVNLDASMALLASLRRQERPTRVVFASSIAVFGPPLPAVIDDDTCPVPTMHYGGQKRMIEVALEQLSAHGDLDGIALRLPGVVARRGADARLKSAFLNTFFYDYAGGRNFTLPVSSMGTVWLLSVTASVRAFIHAAQLSTNSLGRRRAITLPAQRVSMAELLAALAERFPESKSCVSWNPDPVLEASFASQPLLKTAIADELGFRHDGTLSELISEAMEEGSSS